MVVAAIALGAGPAGAGDLPADEALGTNIQALVNYNYLGGPYLKIAGDDGWGAARSDAFWFKIEATKGTYDWSFYDGVKAALDQAGVRWQPILDGSPSWARSDSNQFSPPTESNYPNFTKFAAALASRYGPGGPKAGSKPVTDMEIYNEENVLWTRPASSYATLYAQARAAIHVVQPNERVIVGGVLYDSSPPTDGDWIKSFFAALAGSGADAIGIHPYAPTPIGVVANLRRVQQGLVDAGQSALPLYVNELGYPAALDGATPKTHAAQGPTTDQARAGTISLLTDGLLGSDCNVRNVGYFDLVNAENQHADSSYIASESWKGLERKGSGALTITGTAFRDAGARWRAAPVQGAVHMCGATAGTGTAPLPLGFEVSRPNPLCFNGTVTYRGFPIEEASIVISKPGGGSSSLLTNANGSLDKDYCVTEAGVSFTLQAEVSYGSPVVPRFAQSTAFSCPAASTAACAAVAGSGPPAGGGGPPAGGGGPPAGGGGGGGATGGPACVLKSLKVGKSRSLATALRKGVRLRAGGCDATSAAAISVRVVGKVSAAAARHLKLAPKTAKKPVIVARGSRQVASARATTIVVRFTKTARKRIRHARRVKLTLVVSVAQGTAHGALTRHITLTR
jgi:hypothetical protein